MAVTIRAAAIAVCLSAMATTIYGQPRVDYRNLYERVLAIVPVVGTGTFADPKRPMYAPTPQQMNPVSRTGIIAYTHVLSDNGRFALVEFVARDRSAFQSILADTTIQVFLKGRDQREDAVAAFQKLKKNFDFSHFAARVQ